MILKTTGYKLNFVVSVCNRKTKKAEIQPFLNVLS